MTRHYLHIPVKDRQTDRQTDYLSINIYLFLLAGYFTKTHEYHEDFGENLSVSCQFGQTIDWTPTFKHSYTMHGQVLDSIDHARYLGVDISSDLNFNHHINRVTSNASKSLGFLKRNIKTKHPGIREAAYKTTVRPQVEYASSVWSPYTKKDIHKVEMVQRRATRWILSSYSPYQSVTELQQQLNLRTLEQRRVDAKVIMMFKIIHGLVAIPVPPYFEQPMRSTSGA